MRRFILALAVLACGSVASADGFTVYDWNTGNFSTGWQGRSGGGMYNWGSDGMTTWSGRPAFVPMYAPQPLFFNPYYANPPRYIYRTSPTGNLYKQYLR